MSVVFRCSLDNSGVGPGSMRPVAQSADFLLSFLSCGSFCFSIVGLNDNGVRGSRLLWWPPMIWPSGCPAPV